MGLSSEDLKNVKISLLMFRQIATFLKDNRFDIRAIGDTIRDIGKRRQGNTKPAELYRGKVLKGFKKKHWFEARFMIENIANHWKVGSKKSEKLNQQIAKSIKEAGVAKNQVITQKGVNKLTFDVISGAYSKRFKERNLTGEWIIFKDYGAYTVIFCVAGHRERDEDILLRMFKGCFMEFPFSFSFLRVLLAVWLKIINK